MVVIYLCDHGTGIDFHPWHFCCFWVDQKFLILSNLGIFLSRICLGNKFLIWVFSSALRHFGCLPNHLSNSISFLILSSLPPLLKQHMFWHFAQREYEGFGRKKDEASMVLR